MPVTTTGLFHMSKTKPCTATAADGTFSAMLVVVDRQGVHQVEPWRVTYSGAAAREWWQREGHTLQPGDSLDLTLTHMRVHSIARDRAEATARVGNVAIVARAGANGRQQATTA